MLDLARDTATRYDDSAGIDGLADMVRLPYTDTKGAWIVDATLDGTPVRLWVDTGTPTTLWMGQEGRPGDQHIVLVDQQNGQTDAYVGSADVQFGDEPGETQTVMRVPVSAYLDGLREYFGVQIDGILGLESLTGRKLVTGAEAGAIRLSRRPPGP